MNMQTERMQRVMVCLGVACLGLVPLGPLTAQETKPPANKDAGTDIQKLAQARADAANKTFQVALRSWKSGLPGVKPEDLYIWSVRWLNAQRDLSTKKEDQLAALNEHLRRTQELGRIAAALTKAGQGSPLDTAAAEYYLREAELWLAQAKATARRAEK
jgi:hypothetical protein